MKSFPTHRGTAVSARAVLRDRRGLTLLETMVALAILSIGIASILHAFSGSMASTREAESYSTASILANQVASQLDRETSLEPGPLSGTFDDAPGYSWNANIEEPDSNGLMRTTIEVDWQADANPRRFSMVICLKSPNQATEGSATASGQQPSGGR